MPLDEAVLALCELGLDFPPRVIEGLRGLGFRGFAEGPGVISNMFWAWGSGLGVGLIVQRIAHFLGGWVWVLEPPL